MINISKNRFFLYRIIVLSLFYYSIVHFCFSTKNYRSAKNCLSLYILRYNFKKYCKNVKVNIIKISYKKLGILILIVNDIIRKIIINNKENFIIKF